MTTNKKFLGIVLAFGVFSGFACGDDKNSDDVDVGKIDGGPKADSGIVPKDSGTTETDGGSTVDEDGSTGGDEDAGGGDTDGGPGTTKKTMDDFLNAPTTDDVDTPEKDIGDLDGLLDSDGNPT